MFNIPFVGAVTRWFRGFGVSRIQQELGPQGLEQDRASDSGVNVNVDSALRVSAVWACVMLICETVSTLPLFVYTRDKNRNREVAYDEALFTILHDRPNAIMTTPVFLASMCLNYVLRHNAYAKIIRNQKGEAVALWPLMSGQVECSLQPGVGLVYAHELGGNVDIIAQQNMLHWRGVGNGITGLDPLFHQADTIGGALQQSKTARRIFNHGNRLSGFLSVDRVLTAEQRDAIKSTFRDMVEKPDQQLHVLEAGFKFDARQMTAQEAQQVETLRFTVEDVARTFGVPSILINDVTKNTSWGSGIAEIVEGFTKFKLRPMLKFLEAEIRGSVFSSDQRSRLDVEFSFDALLQGTFGARFEAYTKGISNGITTPNEVRQLENWPAVEGGNQLFVPANLMPIERAKDGRIANQAA